MVILCSVEGCNKPRCKGYSTCCYGHALQTLQYNGYVASARDILEWCGPKPRVRSHGRKLRCESTLERTANRER